MKVTITEEGKTTTIEGKAEIVSALINNYFNDVVTQKAYNNVFEGLFGDVIKKEKTKKKTSKKKKSRRHKYKKWTSQEDQMIYEAYIFSKHERLSKDDMKKLIRLTGRSAEAISTRASNKGWTYSQRKFKHGLTAPGPLQ